MAEAHSASASGNNATFDAAANQQSSALSHYAKACWFTLVYTVSFASNGLSAYNVLASPSLRNPSMHLLCAGFLGNCLCVLVAATLNLASAWVAGSWAFSIDWCYWYVFGTSALGLFNINILTGLSALRCRMVTKNRPFNNSDALALIVLCAVVAAAWSLPPMFGLAGVRRVGHVAACDLDWESGRPGDKAYLAGMLLGEFLLPMAIIVGSYTAIYAHVRTNRASGMLSASESQTRRDRQFISHVLAIIGAFLVCWTPYAILAARSLAGPLPPDSGLYRALSTAALLLAKTGMAASALTYFAVNADFRAAFAVTPVGKRILSHLASLIRNRVFGSAKGSNAGSGVSIALQTEQVEMYRTNSDAVGGGVGVGSSYNSDAEIELVPDGKEEFEESMPLNGQRMEVGVDVAVD